MATRRAPRTRGTSTKRRSWRSPTRSHDRTILAITAADLDEALGRVLSRDEHARILDALDVRAKDAIIEAVFQATNFVDKEIA